MDQNPASASMTLVGEIGGSRRNQQKNERMLQRAIRQRWPIPDELKAKVIQRQIDIATSTTASNREATAAARVLISAEGQNQADELKDVGGSEGAPGAGVPSQHVHFHTGEQHIHELGILTPERLERARMAAIAARGSADHSGDSRSGVEAQSAPTVPPSPDAAE